MLLNEGGVLMDQLLVLKGGTGTCANKNPRCFATSCVSLVYYWPTPMNQCHRNHYYLRVTFGGFEELYTDMCRLLL